MFTENWNYSVSLTVPDIIYVDTVNAEMNEIK